MSPGASKPKPQPINKEFFERLARPKIPLPEKLLKNAGPIKIMHVDAPKRKKAPEPIQNLQPTQSTVQEYSSYGRKHNLQKDKDDSRLPWSDESAPVIKRNNNSPAKNTNVAEKKNEEAQPQSESKPKAETLPAQEEKPSTVLQKTPRKPIVIDYHDDEYAWEGDKPMVKNHSDFDPDKVEPIKINQDDMDEYYVEQEGLETPDHKAKPQQNGKNDSKQSETLYQDDFVADSKQLEPQSSQKRNVTPARYGEQREQEQFGSVNEVIGEDLSVKGSGDEVFVRRSRGKNNDNLGRGNEKTAKGTKGVEDKGRLSEDFYQQEFEIEGDYKINQDSLSMENVQNAQTKNKKENENSKGLEKIKHDSFNKQLRESKNKRVEESWELYQSNEMDTFKVKKDNEVPEFKIKGGPKIQVAENKSPKHGDFTNDKKNDEKLEFSVSKEEKANKEGKEKVEKSETSEIRNEKLPDDQFDQNNLLVEDLSNSKLSENKVNTQNKDTRFKIRGGPKANISENTNSKNDESMANKQEEKALGDSQFKDEKPLKLGDEETKNENGDSGIKNSNPAELHLPEDKSPKQDDFNKSSRNEEKFDLSLPNNEKTLFEEKEKEKKSEELEIKPRIHAEDKHDQNMLVLDNLTNSQTNENKEKPENRESELQLKNDPVSNLADHSSTKDDYLKNNKQNQEANLVLPLAFGVIGTKGVEKEKIIKDSKASEKNISNELELHLPETTNSHEGKALKGIGAGAITKLEDSERKEFMQKDETPRDLSLDGVPNLSTYEKKDAFKNKDSEFKKKYDRKIPETEEANDNQKKQENLVLPFAFGVIGHRGAEKEETKKKSEVTQKNLNYESELHLPDITNPKLDPLKKSDQVQENFNPSGVIPNNEKALKAEVEPINKTSGDSEVKQTMPAEDKANQNKLPIDDLSNPKANAHKESPKNREPEFKLTPKNRVTKLPSLKQGYLKKNEIDLSTSIHTSTRNKDISKEGEKTRKEPTETEIKKPSLPEDKFKLNDEDKSLNKHKDDSKDYFTIPTPKEDKKTNLEKIQNTSLLNKEENKDRLHQIENDTKKTEPDANVQLLEEKQKDEDDELLDEIEKELRLIEEQLAKSKEAEQAETSPKDAATKEGDNPSGFEKAADEDTKVEVFASKESETKVMGINENKLSPMDQKFSLAKKDPLPPLMGLTRAAHVQNIGTFEPDKKQNVTTIQPTFDQSKEKDTSSTKLQTPSEIKKQENEKSANSIYASAKQTNQQDDKDFEIEDFELP